MNKLIRKSLACLMAGGILLGAMSPAAAANENYREPVLTESEVSTFKEFLDEYQVDASTQNELVEKVQSGTAPDSLIPGKSPVSTELVERSGENVEVLRFADGSVNANSQEKPSVQGIRKPGKGGATTYTATRSGCGEVKSGTTRYWNNCKIESRSGLLALSFYADIVIKRGTSVYDSISRVYSGSYYLPASCSAKEDLRIIKKIEGASGSARARYDVTAQACVLLTKNLYWVEVRVGKDSATAVEGKN